MSIRTNAYGELEMSDSTFRRRLRDGTYRWVPGSSSEVQAGWEKLPMVYRVRKYTRFGTRSRYVQLRRIR